MKAELGLHVGEAICRLAGVYPTLLQVLLEAIQNALDGNAKRIRVEINKKDRTFSIFDNGLGVSERHFQKALLSVGKGIKDESKLGRFGLGLISPLGKCEQFTFTSCPNPSFEGYKIWTLNTEEIRSQQSSVVIPLERIDNLRHESFRGKMRGCKEKVWWRTRVTAYGFTTDRIKTQISIESLVQEVETNFSPVMRKLKTSVEMVLTDEKGNRKENIVRGKAFTGKRLEEVEIKEGNQTATFKMFIVKREKVRKGGRINIQFGETENDFRFSFSSFARSSGGGLLDAEVMDGFRTGIFEGEITSSMATLSPSRNCFEKDDNLLDFCTAIAIWFEKYGKKFLEDQKEDRQAQRYQELGIKSLEVLEALWKNGAKSLFEGIQFFKKGNIGKGHIERKGKEQECPSKSVQGRKKEKKSEDASVRNGKPENEHEGHAPFTVQGPEGAKRRIVRSSLGLQICHEDLGGDIANRLWHIDTELGILSFNITHPLWARCDHSDAVLCALQEHIIIHVLTLLVTPEDFREHNRLFIDSEVENFVEYLLNGGIRFARVKK